MKATMVEMEILSLLIDGKPRYGIQIVKNSDILKRGSIYVHLWRMEKRGWIVSEKETCKTVQGIPRRLYEITDEGRIVHNQTLMNDPKLDTLGFVRTCVRGARKLAIHCMSAVAVALLIAAGAAALVGPGMLADKYSMWWLLLYTPHALGVLYFIGEDW